jgi:hypothetical protein
MSVMSGALRGATSLFRRVHFLADALIAVYAGAVSVSVFQTPGATFDGALLALVIMLLAALLMTSSLATLPLLTKYMLFLERWPGRGFLVTLIGVVCYGGTPWRIFCALVTIGIGCVVGKVRGVSARLSLRLSRLVGGPNLVPLPGTHTAL